MTAAAAEPAPTQHADPAARPPHLLSIALEDYFDARPFHQLISERHRRRLESRIEAQTDAVLTLLDAVDARATFFSLGRLAETHGGVLRRIVDAGHEVGARDWEPASLLRGLEASNEIAERVRLEETGRRSRLALSEASGTPVRGFRIARGRFGARGLGMLDAVAAAGFAYDSSFYPTPREGRTRPMARFPFVYESDTGPLVEMPVSTWGPRRLTVPLGGGNLFRQMPGRPVEWMLRDYAARYTSPLNLYFHVWEFDPQLPRLGVGSRLTRIRRYRNLSAVGPMLGRLAERHRFVSIRDYLEHEAPERERQAFAQASTPLADRANHASGRRLAPRPAGGEAPEPLAFPPASAGADEETPAAFTLVVPCYAETAVLGYTAEALDELGAALAPRPLEVIFVDDASPDNTADELERRFGGQPGRTVLRHDRNRGVAAAILTGLRAAKTELVGSMDCDCTYDPMLFAEMLPRFEAERERDPAVALLTASPYHPEGAVLHVPAWRLGLSRGLSAAYRRLLDADLYTFTACVRLYHRPSVERLSLKHGGFLGVAELVVELDRRGLGVLEQPARLESRLLGTSKMKTLGTIRAHLGLLGRVAWLCASGAYAVKRLRPDHASIESSPARTRRPA